MDQFYLAPNLFSWIHREDLARLILFLMTHSSIQGPVNAVCSRGPDDERNFCTTLGKAMNRPSLFPVPEFVLRMTLGELATMLTTGQRVHPSKALEAGFSYSYATLQAALDSLFSQSTQGPNR